MADLSWELIRLVEEKLEAEKNAERERADDDRPMCPAIQELINDAKAAAYAEAVKATHMKFAANMQAMGIPIETIAEVLEEPVSEVEKWIK